MSTRKEGVGTTIPFDHSCYGKVKRCLEIVDRISGKNAESAEAFIGKNAQNFILEAVVLGHIVQQGGIEPNGKGRGRFWFQVETRAEAEECVRRMTKGGIGKIDAYYSNLALNYFVAEKLPGEK